MVKLDDFTYVFIITVVLLGVLILISGFQPPSGFDQRNAIASFDVGPVGSISEQASISQNLESFVVGEAQYASLKSQQLMVIERGYFGGNGQNFDVDVSKAFMNNARGARIEFSVADTNQYGNLVIKWNSKEVMNEKHGTGAKTIQIPATAIKEKNNVEIYAETPGFFFWASTAYRIRDFQIDLEYGPEKIVPFELSPSELQIFSSGVITFNAQESTNRLLISVNNRPVYQEIPVSANVVDFNLITASLFPGVNTIAFSAPDDKIQISNVKLDIFLNTDTSVKTRSFLIDQVRFNQISQGILKLKLFYTVSEIKRPGALQVKINNQNVPGVVSQEGENSININPSLFRQGENVIEFSASGSFSVDEASIALV